MYKEIVCSIIKFGGECRMWPKEGTVYITGYSKLPEGISAAVMYEVLVIGLKVDVETSKIVDVDCSLALALSKEILRKIMIGRSLEEDITDIVTEIKLRYHGSAQKAIIAALKSAFERYRFCKEAKP
ncbi:MAG: DUF3870 domain-containing protein [Synergistetes bacterium]|nr:DUF3870 domain-containing protein [Synergistota bacterium]